MPFEAVSNPKKNRIIPITIIIIIIIIIIITTMIMAKLFQHIH